MIICIQFVFFTAHAYQCLPVNEDQLEFSAVNELIANTSAPNYEVICNQFAKIKTEDDLKNALSNLRAYQRTKLTPHPGDRHKVGEKLNHCYPDKNSKALVINFAGTGAYDPRTFDLVEKAAKCSSTNKMPPELADKVYSEALEVVKKDNAPTKWSGIEKGPLSEFFKNDHLRSVAADCDFVSFASEESEMIAEPEKLTKSHFKNLPKEILKSSLGVPTGITNATKCISTYLKKAKELKIKPKIIIMSHSSGGRSAVKFAEILKDSKIEVDLAFTMDPVVEAQDAMTEVMEQYAGKARDKALDKLPFVDVKNDTPVKVWKRDHRKKLYKTTNTKRWVSVYQTKDTEGLKNKDIPFGIQGSKIYNADINQYINDKDLGSGAHGEICYHKKTLELFVDEFSKVVK
jgi:hypothetical protein